MGRERNPRHGSMSVWPRKRARRMHARIRSWLSIKDAKPVGFAGYKVGMTHLIATASFLKPRVKMFSCR